MTSAALASAREWGAVYGYPAVVYEREWRPGVFDVCGLDFWLKVKPQHMPVHALVYAGSIIPLTLLEAR